MITQVELSPAPLAMLTAAAGCLPAMNATAGIQPMSSDQDYVSPYLRRPLRKLDEVERARQSRENRRPQVDRGEQKNEGPARRDQ